MDIEFATFTDEEDAAVTRIIERLKVHVEGVNALSTRMDLACVHAATPLDLVALSEADNFNLFHDVLGIATHLDRSTGALRGHFVPRYGRN